MYGGLPKGPQFPSPVVGKHNPKLQIFGWEVVGNPPPEQVWG